MEMGKELTIEELEKQYLEAEKTYKALHEQFMLEKKKEEEAQKKKFEVERKLRHEAVVKAYMKFEQLRSNYVEDYGSFMFETKNENGNTYSWLWTSRAL